jgi:hypothetical protein
MLTINYHLLPGPKENGHFLLMFISSENCEILLHFVLRGCCNVMYCKFVWQRTFNIVINYDANLVNVVDYHFASHAKVKYSVEMRLSTPILTLLKT